MRPGLTAGATLAVALAVGCSRPVDPREAERTVQRFFDALPAGDCAVLQPMLANAADEAQCRSIVDEMNAHRVRLLAVKGSKVDGRDKRAVIVTADMEHQGERRKEPLLIRVESHDGSWRIRL